VFGELGRYSIEEPAGRGGLGALYRARQPALERSVALEVIDPALRERAEREARILGSIEHPNLVGVYEAGEADGHLFIAWRWIAGTDLGELLAAGLEQPRAADILGQVADALEVAHEHGLVHGAIRPENIRVAPGDHAYLTNFAGGSGPAAADRQALHELRDAAMAAAPAPEPAPAAPLRSRRPLLIAAAVVALFVVVAVAAVLMSGGGEEQAKRVTRPDTGPLPGGSPKVEHVSLGPNVAPGDIAIDDNGLYIGDRRTSDLLFADPETGKVANRMKLRRWYAMETDPFRPGRLWVSVPTRHRLLQIDTARAAFAGRPLRVPGQPARIGVAEDELVLTLGDPSKTFVLRRFDKSTGRPLGPSVSEKHSTGTDLDLAAGGIDVTHWIGAAILTYDDKLQNKRFIDFKIPGVDSILGPQGTETAVGVNDTAWTLVNYVNPNKIAVVRTDLKAKRQVGKMIDLGTGQARDIAVADGVVWVPNVGQGTVSRIDERTGRLIGKPIRVGEIEGDLVAKDGRAWITGARDLIRITP
jgi:tRNA A-37 threonylcarbamoyl transferase component Bud32